MSFDKGNANKIQLLITLPTTSSLFPPHDMSKGGGCSLHQELFSFKTLSDTQQPFPNPPHKPQERQREQEPSIRLLLSDTLKGKCTLKEEEVKAVTLSLP